MNQTNIYIPALLKFVDDKISISEDIQTDIKDSISSPFIDDLNDNGFNYRINSKALLKRIATKMDNIEGLEIKIYYYHHRVIFHYILNHKISLTSKLSSDVRKLVIDDFIINIELLINQINNGVITSNNFKNEKEQNSCKVIMYYSYPIIFQKYDEDTMDNLSNKLETMYFRIFFPNDKLLSYGSKAYIRISIPSFNVFYNDTLSNEIISNVLNAIYQTVLYKKKTSDLKLIEKEIELQKNESIPFSTKLLNEYNVIDEKLLTNIWVYALDSLGGKISDNQQAKVSKTMFIVSMISLGIAVLSLIIALFL